MDSDSEDDKSRKLTASLENNEDDDVPDNRPKIPDESKWDIIYCLPVFIKPGKHTYMIKFKNTKERSQSKVIKQKAKVQQEMDLAVQKCNDTTIIEASLKAFDKELKAETFFYTCNVVPRTEPL